MLFRSVRVGVLTACITGRYRCSPSKVVQAIVYLHRPNCFRNKLWPSSEPSRFNTLQELNMFFRRHMLFIRHFYYYLATGRLAHPIALLLSPLVVYDEADINSRKRFLLNAWRQVLVL